jgi:hypothetical protein
MKPFQPPTKELATRILEEVDFQDRLIGHKMRRRMGPVPVSLYSFEQVVRFLIEDIPQIDLDDLQTWVGEKIGDKDLARAIEEIGRREIDDPEKLLHVRGLMMARLGQSRRIGRLP